MSPTTIAGTQIGIDLSQGANGTWVASGRIIDGALPGRIAAEATGSSRSEAEALCRSKLERLIHAQTCIAE